MKSFIAVTLTVFTLLTNLHAAEAHPAQVIESVTPFIFATTPQDIADLHNALFKAFPNDSRVGEILNASFQKTLKLDATDAKNFAQSVVKIADEAAQELARIGANIEELKKLTEHPLIIKIIDRLQEMNLKDNKRIRVKTYFYAYSNLLIFIAVYVCFIKLLIESGNFKN